MICAASLFPTETFLLTLNVSNIKDYKLFSSGNWGNYSSQGNGRNSILNVDQGSDRPPTRLLVQEQQRILFSIYNGTAAEAAQNETLSDYYLNIFFCPKQRFK